MPLKKVLNNVEALKPQTPDTWFALDTQRSISNDALLMIRVFDDLYPSADVFNNNYFNINTEQLYLLSVTINGTRNPLTTVNAPIGQTQHNIIATFMIRNFQEQKYETVRTEINTNKIASGTSYLRFRVKNTYEVQSNEHSGNSNVYENVEMLTGTSSNYNFRITSSGVTLNRIGNGALPFFSTGNYLGQIFRTTSGNISPTSHSILAYTRNLVAYVQAAGGGGAGSRGDGNVSYTGDSGQAGGLEIVEKAYNQEAIGIIIGSVGSGGTPTNSGGNANDTSFTLNGITTAIGGRGGLKENTIYSGTAPLSGKHGQNSMFGKGGIASIGNGYPTHASGYGASGAAGHTVSRFSSGQRHGTNGSPGCVLIKCYG